MPVTAYTDVQLDMLRSPRLSHVDAADLVGTSEASVRRWRRANGVASAVRPAAAPAAPLGKAGVTTTDGVSTATSEVLEGGLQTHDAEGYLRERWGFAAEKWLCVSAVGNEWQGQRAGGEVVTFAQVKGSFRPIHDITALIPAPAEFRPLPPIKRVKHHAGGYTCLVLSDHQAPYHDEALHAATLALIKDVRPGRIAHIGDLCDYTNISKHRDHAVVRADVDDCTQAGVDILRSLRDAAPDARIQILAGNHDIRPLSELLLRAERMAGIRAGDLYDGKGREDILSLRRLWRLDDLGIELAEDPRGWEHAELCLVPGVRGLVAAHGWLTGANVAARTLEKVGRSVIIGHTHRPEHVFKWSQQLQCEQQAVVVGAQCEVRGGKNFPTFVARDGWLQGPALVTVYGPEEFAIERCRWSGDSLYASGMAYTP